MKKKQIPSISRAYGYNCDFVSVSIDGSHLDQGQHKPVISLLPQKNPTVDLTATSNSDHYSLDKDYDKEDDLPTQKLSTTDDEENDETEDPFEPAKPSPSAAAPITQLYHHILLQGTQFQQKHQFFQSLKYLLVHHHILYQVNQNQCQLTTSLLEFRFMVNILRRL